MNDLSLQSQSQRSVRRSAAPRFSGWRSLVTRILAVNLVALLALAGALFYIESFRSRLLETREQELLRQGEIIAQFLENQGLQSGAPAILDISSPRGTRIRLYDAQGRLVVDNWKNPHVTRFELIDPTTEGFPRQSAIAIDRLIDLVAGEAEAPLLQEGAAGEADDAADAMRVGAGTEPQSWSRQTRDRLVVLNAAVPLSGPGMPPSPVILLSVDTPDVIDLVRRERATSFLVFLAVLAVSLTLSAYLARTIVVPLRQLAMAAHRVRLGRQRDVVVPRLPHRRDEIGGLARALADMSAALRQRIDATEAFAADVAHELKNPLASLRSAVEALGTVKDAKSRAQLFGLIDEDVRRIDRLITDISAASRLDAELSRARMQPVDLGKLVSGLLVAQTAAGQWRNGVKLETALPSKPVMVWADGDRVAQVLNNLIDNALSFSPVDGVIRAEVKRQGQQVELSVQDDGPGVPEEARDAIFERFYSERPHHEDYGQHSGLGLSIARAIVEAMDGQIRVTDRGDGKSGAVFIVSLPAL